MGTVVVIGHGPSAEGKGWGARIEVHPVVRMFNSAWQKPKDYGRRYDYGLFAPPLGHHAWAPSEAWWAYDVNGRTVPALIDGVSVVLLHHEPWTTLAMHLGGEGEGRRFKLTRGCVAVCAAIELLKPDRLLLVGMDMMQKGATISPRYGAGAQADFDQAMAGKEHVFKPAGETREGAHDLAAEARLVAVMAEENSVELVWMA